MNSGYAKVSPYTALAEVYDDVMQHVDYRAWAIYIAELLQKHAGGSSSVLEMACGTGSLAQELLRLMDLDYTGFDVSPEMVDVARLKAANQEVNAEFLVSSFDSVDTGSQYDIILLLYDGLNYITDPQDVTALFARVASLMHQNSIFIFDNSTPVNSIKNVDYFEDYGKGDDFSYYRSSSYDTETRLHTTTFEIAGPGGTFLEEHVQRAYSLHDVLKMLDAARLSCVASYEDFTHDSAGDESERIHFVVKHPNN